MTMDAFERTTYLIMTDVRPEEFLAVRQLMLKNGYLNISDLSRALNQ